MRIIISPAKKMDIDLDGVDSMTRPAFIEKAERLKSRLLSMTFDELKELWRCSDKLASHNFKIIEHMDLNKNLTAAVLAYNGIQYKYMAPSVFTNEEFCYVQERLRILSGFYGILRPLDGVVPYRLEMQSKLSADGFNNLYEFWGKSLAQHLCSETDFIINLASKEYSRIIKDNLPDNVRFLTCSFAEIENGRLIEKGVRCKMARGEMVRYMAENAVTEAQELKGFNRLGYKFSPKHSSESGFLFIKSS